MDTRRELQALLNTASEVLLGKEQRLRLALTCLLARGHLLIEDLPGVGKTTLAELLARLLDLDFQRIQFTSDLLPADILGAAVYEQERRAFAFHAGPIFANLVLADEVNRATPKTQSALLEAMAERQVTIEGDTRPLPAPFFVIATQNPGTQIGTFPLPDSQLDRFLMRIDLGYPGESAEGELLAGRERGGMLKELEAILSANALADLQQRAAGVQTSPALIAYVQALLGHSRGCGRFRVGLSPRAGLALLAAARAWAFLEDRRAVLPEDIQAVFGAVAGHRLEPAGDIPEADSEPAMQRLIGEVAIP